MPSFIEPHRTPLRKSEKVWSYERFFFIDDEDDEKFLLNGSTYGAVSASRHRVPEFQRPHVGGKFLFVGNNKFWVRGVTYGAFRPGPSGQEYHDLNVLERETFL